MAIAYITGLLLLMAYSFMTAIQQAVFILHHELSHSFFHMAERIKEHGVFHEYLRKANHFRLKSQIIMATGKHTNQRNKPK